MARACGMCCCRGGSCAAGRGCSSACCADWLPCRCCPRDVSRTTRAILAWDIGVIVFLVLSAFLFTTERLDRMPADAEAQEEGEWTIFWLTVAAVTFSFVAIIGEFAGTKDLPPAQRNLHVILVAVTLFVSWLMTHTTFAFRYAHEYYDDRSGRRRHRRRPGVSRREGGRTISTSCISHWCWA